jgi:hypothetical protein
MGMEKNINILVKFRSDKIGSFGEEVVFDFGGYPKVVKKLGVQVGNEESLAKVHNFNILRFFREILQEN